MSKVAKSPKRSKSTPHKRVKKVEALPDDMATKAPRKPKTEQAEWTPRIWERLLPSGSTSIGADWWVKEAGKGYRRVARFFPSYDALNEWLQVERLRRRRDESLKSKAVSRGDAGVFLLRLSSPEQLALVKAVQAIQAAGGKVENIEDATAHFVKAFLTGAKKTVAEVVEEHLSAVKQRRREETWKDRRRKLTPLAEEHGQTLISALTPAVVEDWVFAGNTESMRAARRRALSALFTFAERRGYVESNPVLRVEKIETPPPEEVQILDAKETAAVLHTAERMAPRLVPYLAIGFFAGLRPQNESGRLNWENIDLKAGMITVSRISSKTNRKRLVPISPNLAVWLKTIPKQERTGRIFFSRRMLDNILKEARVGKKRVTWGKDVMRHTRTSFRFVQTKDKNLTAFEGGHSQDIMTAHYVNAKLSEKEVAEYWNILPSRQTKDL